MPKETHISLLSLNAEDVLNTVQLQMGCQDKTEMYSTSKKSIGEPKAKYWTITTRNGPNFYICFLNSNTFETNTWVKLEQLST